MFDAITNEDLRALMGVASPICVSIYLPTHAAGSSVAEDPIRLKNLIAEVKQELERLEVRPNEVTKLLEPVEATMDDPQFWAHSAAGLALFVTSEGMQSRRLQGPVEEAVMVSDQLWIAPLIPFVMSGGAFHVLALSENQVRVLRGNRSHMTEVDLGGIPASLAEALPFDDREAQLQSHGADRVGSGQVASTFHGQGGGSDFDAIDQARFLHLVDRGLVGALGDVGSSPLVLAGVDEIVSRFRNLSSHSNIAESFIPGNPEHLSPQELLDRALPLVAADLDADRLRAHEQFSLPSTPTVETVAGALEAAANGLVAKLFIPSGEHTWGSFDPDSRLVEEHADRRPGDRDLIDLTARETLGHGGDVFAVDASEMPDNAPVAAMLRY